MAGSEEKAWHSRIKRGFRDKKDQKNALLMAMKFPSAGPRSVRKGKN